MPSRKWSVDVPAIGLTFLCGAVSAVPIRLGQTAALWFDDSFVQHWVGWLNPVLAGLVLGLAVLSVGASAFVICRLLSSPVKWNAWSVVVLLSVWLLPILVSYSIVPPGGW